MLPWTLFTSAYWLLWLDLAITLLSHMILSASLSVVPFICYSFVGGGVASFLSPLISSYFIVMDAGSAAVQKRALAGSRMRRKGPRRHCLGFISCQKYQNALLHCLPYWETELCYLGTLSPHLCRTHITPMTRPLGHHWTEKESPPSSAVTCQVSFLPGLVSVSRCRG